MELVTLESALNALEHLEQSNSSGRKAEAREMLEAAATPSPVPADTAELPPLTRWTPTIKDYGDGFDRAVMFEAEDGRWCHYNEVQTHLASRPAPVAEPVALDRELIVKRLEDACSPGVNKLTRKREIHSIMQIVEAWGQSMYREGKYAAPVAAVPEGEFVRAGWFLYEGIEWTPTSSDDPHATILYRKAQPDQSAQEVVDLSKLKHADNCRYWEDSEFCTCGADTYEQLQKARARIAELEAAAAPSAAQAAGVDKLHSAILNLPCHVPDYVTHGDPRNAYQYGARDIRHAAAELVAAHFATTPSEGVAAPVANGELLTPEQRAAIKAAVRKAYPNTLAWDLMLDSLAWNTEQACYVASSKAAPAQPSADQVRDAARWRYSMEYQELARTGQPQPDPILAMWSKVYDEHRLHPTREEYEAAIDAAMRASGEKGADRG